MDYSQFGSMIPELIVLGIFMLVFLFDTFSNENGKKILTPFTTVLFGLGTIAIWVVPACGEMVFGGMYINDTATNAIKAILNIGVFIVFLQSAKWVDSDEVAIRKGEFLRTYSCHTVRHVSDGFCPSFSALHHRS